MCFQSENPVFKFLRGSVDGAESVQVDLIHNWM